MSSFGHSLWTTLASYTFSKPTPCSNIVRLSDTKFITVYDSNIHEYHTQNNKWNIISSDFHAMWMNEVYIAFDTTNNQIYASYLDTLKIFDMNTKTCSNKKLYLGPIILINGMLHIIGGTGTASHFVWNMAEDKDAENIEKIHDFGLNWSSFGYVYVDRTQEIYCFGGWGGWPGGRLNEIKKFCIKSKKWTTLKCKLIEDVDKCGCAIDKSQRYVLILGGFRSGISCHSDTIQVFDIERSSVYKSNIKLPITGGCKAIIMDDGDTAIKLIPGYIRQYFENAFPSALIKLIIDWYTTEFVHIISMFSEAMHCKICLNDVLSA